MSRCCASSWWRTESTPQEAGDATLRSTWFLSEANARGLAGDLVLDVDDHPSEVCAGAALVVRDGDGPAVLVIRTRSAGWELPKGGIEWDELPEEAAVRELREESGAAGELGAVAELGRLDYFLGAGRERRLKQVRYYVARALGELTLGDLPKRTWERCWLHAAEVDSAPLVSEDLRALLRAALDRGTSNG